MSASRRVSPSERFRARVDELFNSGREGPITLERPKLRGNREPFASRLLGIGVTRTKALESLVIAGFVRGRSTRDVEATLDEALGEQAALSKSTVSRICGVLVSRFELWQRRDLSDYELDYLFADASFFNTTRPPRGSRSSAPGASPPRVARSSST